MPPFWDQFVFRTYATFGENYSPGLHTAARLLQLAADRQLLPLADLDDLSLTLLVLTCTADLPVRRQAEELLRQRRVPAADLGDALLQTCPLRLTDLLSVAHLARMPPLDPGRRGPILDALERLLVPSLRRFLSRMYLNQEMYGLAPAYQYLVQAFGSFDLWQVSVVQFPAHLYALVVKEMPRPVPTRWAHPLPVWAQHVEPAERQFIDAVLALPERHLKLPLFLAFYGQLNLSQILYVVNQVSSRRITFDRLLTLLHQGWERVLQAL
jgi:hypothetical protein